MVAKKKEAFLESSTLIGYLRHGGLIPWDSDVDIGILEEDCLRSQLTKEKVFFFPYRAARDRDFLRMRV